MAAKDTLKSLLKMASCRVTDVIFGWRHRRRWLDKDGLGGMHEHYFDDYLSRAGIADAIVGVVTSARIDTARIIEFGCSGGNNLRLLRERLGAPFRYCGLDIQEAAIEFARQRFPDDTFYRCSDAELPALKPKLGRFDIFLASGVFYYLPQKETLAVLNFAAEIADYLVVWDSMERFYLPTGENDGLFKHPYGLMLQKAGFELVAPPSSSNPESRHGRFVARVQRSMGAASTK